MYTLYNPDTSTVFFSLVTAHIRSVRNYTISCLIITNGYRNSGETAKNIIKKTLLDLWKLTLPLTNKYNSTWCKGKYEWIQGFIRLVIIFPIRIPDSDPANNMKMVPDSGGINIMLLWICDRIHELTITATNMLKTFDYQGVYRKLVTQGFLVSIGNLAYYSNC